MPTITTEVEGTDGLITIYFNTVQMGADKPHNVIDSIELWAKAQGHPDMPVDLYLALNDHVQALDPDADDCHIHLTLEDGVWRALVPDVAPTRCSKCGEHLNQDDRRWCGGDTWLCRECKVEEMGGLEGFRG